MPSVALENWSGDRLGLLDAMARRVSSQDLGEDDWYGKELISQLFVVLASQFQGFCRELHDQASQAHIDATDPRRQEMMRRLLTMGRRLDTGNANRGNLGHDFARLGFPFSDSVTAADPSAAQRLATLDCLLDYRNAVAHGNQKQSEALGTQPGGVVPTMDCYETHRGNLERLAVSMDTAVGNQLGVLLGQAPW